MYFQCFPGQNKNIFIVLMFMYLIQQGILKEVHLDFMVSGHSYLPCDRGFGNIETACKRMEIINGPAHYTEIIRKIKNTNVHHMKQEEILHIKSLRKRITMRTSKVQDMYFSKARKIVLSEDHPHQYRLIQAQGTVMVDLKKKKRKGLISDEPIPKKYAHGQSLKISAEKLADVQHFKDFLNQAGKNWISQVVNGQITAQPRPQIDPEHEVTPDENIQDDNQYLDYAPMPPPLVEADLEDHDADADMFPGA